ncbi:MAG: hypothetical protein MI745_03870 [Pseudomonadales bacterium]|nr:hypothetical protein [Pseudomonadales bacterium]
MRWLSAVKEKLFPSPRRQDHDEPAHEPLDYHPAHEGDTPDDLHRGRHRLKETFTSHWDLDYLPRDEVEEIMKEEKKRPGGNKDQGTSE